MLCYFQLWSILLIKLTLYSSACSRFYVGRFLWVGEGGRVVFLFFYCVLFSLSLGRQLDMTEILLTGQLNLKKREAFIL